MRSWAAVACLPARVEAGIDHARTKANVNQTRSPTRRRPLRTQRRCERSFGSLTYAPRTQTTYTRTAWCKWRRGKLARFTRSARRWTGAPSCGLLGCGWRAGEQSSERAGTWLKKPGGNGEWMTYWPAAGSRGRERGSQTSWRGFRVCSRALARGVAIWRPGGNKTVHRERVCAGRIKACVMSNCFILEADLIGSASVVMQDDGALTVLKHSH